MMGLVSKVFMSPKNANLFVAIPLYADTAKIDLDLSDSDKYIIYGMVKDLVKKPVAYALDIGEDKLALVDAEFIEKEMIYLGDL